MICNNPNCDTKYFVPPKKSPKQKYCNKKCYSDHLNSKKITHITICNNDACTNNISNNKKYCSSSCAAIVRNATKPNKKYTYDKLLLLYVSRYYSCNKQDITDLHVEKYFEDIVFMRTIYNMSIFDINLKCNGSLSSRKFISNYLKEIGCFNKLKPKPKTKQLKPKTKPKQLKNQSSKVIINTCYKDGCGNIFYTKHRKKYCQEHQGEYAKNKRNQYLFSFNVFNYPMLFDLDMISKIGFYHSGNKTEKPKNINGLSRDHKVSVADAIKYNYDPYYITHPVNCEIMYHKDNNKKNTNSSISYTELIILVNEFDKIRTRTLPS